MIIASKPYKVDLEDLLEANKVMLLPVLKYQRKVFGILCLVLLGLMTVLVLIEGLPETSREAKQLFIGFGSAAGLYCGATFVGTFRDGTLRRQLNSRNMQKYRDREISVVFEEGMVRVVRQAGESTLSLDELFRFELSSQATCLFHPGYNSIVILKKEHFESDVEWKALVELLELTPRLKP